MHTLQLPPSGELFEALVLYVFVVPIAVICIFALALWVLGTFQIAI